MYYPPTLVSEIAGKHLLWGSLCASNIKARVSFILNFFFEELELQQIFSEQDSLCFIEVKPKLSD